MEPSALPDHDPAALDFYQRSIETARRSGLPFLVGGAYALRCYTGISRDTKDLDIFVLPEDVKPMLDTFAAAGLRVEVVFTHWLAKAFQGDRFVDIIFGEGNGLSGVNREWFDRAAGDRLLGIPVKLVPSEELIRSKAFIMERERYDGADVAHLLRARAASLDWKRLLDLFGPHWRVLLSHLVLFGFIYPGERSMIAPWIMKELIARLEKETVEADPPGQVCQGTLISREQYLIDIHQRGYRDPRLGPAGRMTGEEVERWTRAIGK